MQRINRWRTAAWIAGLALVFLLYIWGLSTNPPGYYVDESALSYNAYLFSRTAAGEFGGVFPLYFELFSGSFTAYTSPSQIYLLGILFFLIGPSILTARIFSAFWVFSACILLGVLAKRLSNKMAVAVIVSLTALVTPWLFDVRGLLLEAHFIPFATVVLLLALYRATTKERWGWLDSAMIAGGLCLITYCYTSGRGLGVLLASGLAIFLTKRSYMLGVLKTWFLYGVALLPLIVYSFQNPGVLTRRLYSVGSINPGMPFSEMIPVLMNRFIEDTALSAWLLTGDHHARHHVPGSGGAIFFATFALATIGLGVLICRRRLDRWWLFVIFGLLVSVIPGSVANEPFHQLRMMGCPIFLLILTVPALDWMIGNVRDLGWFKGSEGEKRDWLAVASLWMGRGALTLFLLATVLQAYSYLSIFSEKGPQRQFDFDSAYKSAYQAAIAQSDRPIYLEDGFWGPAYIHALWYAAVDGVDRSNFVHLAEGERPPDGVLVLSSNNTCSRCEVVSRHGSYLLYRTTDREGMVDLPVPGVVENKAPEPVPEALPRPHVISPPASKPHGIAVDGAGNIFITDAGNHRVLKLSSSGEIVTVIGEDTLSEPTGVAIDPAGDILVADAGKKILFKFNADGTLMRQWGPDAGFDEPRDVTVGRDKQIYVSDRGGARIVKLDGDRGKTSEWGSRGPGEGQFDTLNGIGAGGDHMYAADAQNDRIQVFDLSGGLVREWPVPQWAKYLWHRPDVAVDQKSDLVYVTSGWTHEVLIFDTEGNFIKPLKPEPPAKFNNPSSIVLSDTKRGKFLYVLNTGADVVDSGPPSILIFDLTETKK